MTDQPTRGHTPTSPVTVRVSTAADNAAAAAVWYAAWHDGHRGHVTADLIAARDQAYFRRQAAALTSSTLVAVRTDTIVGLVIVVGDEVVQLVVAGEARRTGAGAALLTAAEDRIATQFAQAWLAVVPGNSTAREFYHRRGWRDEGPMTYRAPSATGPIPVLVHRYVKHLR